MQWEGLLFGQDSGGFAALAARRHGAVRDGRGGPDCGREFDVARDDGRGGPDWGR